MQSDGVLFTAISGQTQYGDGMALVPVTGLADDVDLTIDFASTMSTYWVFALRFTGRGDIASGTWGYLNTAGLTVCQTVNGAETRGPVIPFTATPDASPVTFERRAGVLTVRQAGVVIASATGLAAGLGLGYVGWGTYQMAVRSVTATIPSGA